MKRVHHSVTYQWLHTFVPLFQLSAIVSQYLGSKVLTLLTISEPFYLFNYPDNPYANICMKYNMRQWMKRNLLVTSIFNLYFWSSSLGIHNVNTQQSKCALLLLSYLNSAIKWCTGESVIVLGVYNNLHHIVRVAFEHLLTRPLFVPVPQLDQHVICQLRTGILLQWCLIHNYY
jgi:hypothetical protein